MRPYPHHVWLPLNLAAILGKDLGSWVVRCGVARYAQLDSVFDATTPAKSRSFAPNAGPEMHDPQPRVCICIYGARLSYEPYF